MLRLMRAKLILTSLLALLASGCVETGDSTGASDVIPDVEVQCNRTLCASSGTATLYVGLTSDLDADCQDLINTFTNFNPFSQNFDAWGTGTVILDGGFQTAFITDWYDANNALIGRLEQGTYLMCGFYDTNDNQQLDALEGFGEDEIDFSEGYVIFDNWSFN
ncbi:MAG: hypothetical protein HRT45_08260 [Bdellovibrionales bacterium]|nr:hypothetical protein [Bdellovibrionales bacterium]